MPRVDDRFAKLGALGYTGSAAAMLLAWLQDNGAKTSKTVNDAWLAFLSAQGITAKQVNDAKYQYFGSLGYTGTLDDRESKFWEGGNITGKNLIQADFLSGANWTMGAGWAAPGSNLAVSTAATGNLSAVAGPFSIGKTYRISLFVSAISAGTFRAQLTGGGAGGQTPIISTTGLFTYDVTPAIGPITGFRFQPATTPLTVTLAFGITARELV